ncbi:hypothetical protein HPP92_000251 [Vanilla planifolia]|uniref:Galactokinase N-terminal domain-containing protein n=1 Tax=Vanilla planifolia TaxID=51239 RepID=A0A835RXQ4_VANPL|nr:hypothetical protein HPP92_000251 [Vanilla planifolia]
MGASSWPSATEILDAKTKVSEMSGREVEDVKVVVSPYRICPLGAHIDHQVDEMALHDVQEVWIK